VAQFRESPKKSANIGNCICNLLSTSNFAIRVNEPHRDNEMMQLVFQLVEPVFFRFYSAKRVPLLYCSERALVGGAEGG
jgi:hypothetical protein